jgi:hypothetical protein
MMLSNALKNTILNNIIFIQNFVKFSKKVAQKSENSSIFMKKSDKTFLQNSPNLFNQSKHTKKDPKPTPPTNRRNSVQKSKDAL